MACRDYYSVLPLSRRWAAPLRCSFSRLELDAVAEHKAAREAIGSGESPLRDNDGLCVESDDKTCGIISAASLPFPKVATRARGPDMSWHGHDDEARALQVWPLDEHNIATLDAVRPRGWEDPPPAVEYDLIAIGAGAGGLVSAKQSGRRGARSAMISEHLAGGDCLNVGCVPSKALLRCARAIKEVRRAAEFGVVISGPPPAVDFGAIMSRMRRLRAAIAPADAHSASAAAGVDVFQGRGRFTGPNTVEVNGTTLRFKKAVIATGGRASVPDVPGLATAPYVTNATLYNLTALPERLVVLGCGTIALEMAQAFAAFGSQVTCTNPNPNPNPNPKPKPRP